MRPTDQLLDRAESMLGSPPVSWRPATGGYSIAERWTLHLADGRRVFAKMATSDDIASRLRDEYSNMSAIDGDFRCEVIAWENSDRPLLLLEDLSEGRWPPPWEPGDVGRVLESLDRVAKTEPPPHLPSADVYWHRYEAWRRIAADPDDFLGLGLCTRDWIERCLPNLIHAEEGVEITGSDLVHGDMWSSNICLLDDRVVFVDWNAACRGDRRCDIALFLPALRLEGGPLPDEVRPGMGRYASALSGFFAVSAVLPPPADAPAVRKFQLRQLRIALPWACRELGLQEPDVPYASIEIEQLNDDLARGRITDADWHERTEEVLIDAYLSYVEPWRQSGKGGDETDWRWGRELVLDVFPPEATFLDVGCANGHLMESLHSWGAERGVRVEPYGLDISWRIASLAKMRLPQWADRIYVGNAIDWDPPRRFDVVQIGVDEVPPHRRRELVERILREFLVPGGRLVIRAGRRGDTDPGPQLEALGFRPSGAIEAVHPRTGDVRRTAYITAS
jgi:SAM-dependent methyltransferase